MERKKLFFLLFILLFLGVIFSVNALLYYREKTILGPEVREPAIFIAPDNAATRTAANYLSYSIEDIFGKELTIVTEKEDVGKYISIICGAEAKLDSAPVYTISIEQDGININVKSLNHCFGAVKAVTDCWLQQDCGLQKNAELRISRAMIKKQLLHLSTAVSGEIKILTQNLRYTDDGDGNSIAERAERFLQLAAEYQPDLIGTQECTYQWLQLLLETLSDQYVLFGNSRLGADTNAGEWNVILYRKDRFLLQEGDTFWLSNTPSTAASKLNYDGPPRICTWALLQDLETGKTFLFINTHFQNGDTDSYLEVRVREAEILLRRLRSGGINRLKEYPGFLTGDFNGEPGEPYYSEVTAWYEDARNTAITDSSAVDYSYHGYGQTGVLCDFCFHSPDNVTILDYRILDKKYGGYVSDHYGVLVIAVLN